MTSASPPMVAAVEGHDHEEGSMKLHGSAALSRRQRRRLVVLVGSGMTIAAAAAIVGCSRQTGSKWVNRHRRGDGLAGPFLASASLAQAGSGRRSRQAVLRARAELRAGPHVIGWATGVAASTVHAILRRHGCSRLAPPAAARPDRPLRARAAGRARPHRLQEARSHRQAEPPRHRRPPRPQPRRRLAVPLRRDRRRQPARLRPHLSRTRPPTRRSPSSPPASASTAATASASSAS